MQSATETGVMVLDHKCRIGGDEWIQHPSLRCVAYVNCQECRSENGGYVQHDVLIDSA